VRVGTWVPRGGIGWDVGLDHVGGYWLGYFGKFGLVSVYLFCIRDCAYIWLLFFSFLLSSLDALRYFTTPRLEFLTLVYRQ